MGWTRPLELKKKRKNLTHAGRAVNPSFLDSAFQVAAFQLTHHNTYTTPTSVHKPNSIHSPKIWKKWQNLEK